MGVKPDKRLTKLVLRFGNIDWEKASAKQYELEKELGVWRIFLNGYAKNGFVVFDGEMISKESIMEKLTELEPEVVGEETITAQQLIESSYSWNNIIGKAKS
ncbi:hypothetical protein A3L11_01885 [Thermococcus siculi]|uniref:DUF3213 domain-containing protein n=1 Tax=Thermococcus siculi TaxID=72803 RepID=A0A2Z2MVW6_9EURY|nr:DUF3213 domain-containing protein [Thermococcus siculi]ASJ08040.1 hypothetical protein A3L11_01885 [Thermococcus siculi]